MEASVEWNSEEEGYVKQIPDFPNGRSKAANDGSFAPQACAWDLRKSLSL